MNQILVNNISTQRRNQLHNCRLI